jgi:hypothetical protein
LGCALIHSTQLSPKRFTTSKNSKRAENIKAFSDDGVAATVSALADLLNTT